MGKACAPIVHNNPHHALIPKPMGNMGKLFHDLSRSIMGHYNSMKRDLSTNPHALLLTSIS